MLVPIGAGTGPGVQPSKALGDSFVLRGRGVGDDLADQDAIRQRGEENVIVRRGGSYSKTVDPAFQMSNTSVVLPGPRVTLLAAPGTCPECCELVPNRPGRYCSRACRQRAYRRRRKGGAVGTRGEPLLR